MIGSVGSGPGTAPWRKRRERRRFAFAAAVGLGFALIALGGCATNPATGERMMSLMSAEEEARIGAQEHERLLPAFGGKVSDEALQRYIASIGNLLARTSELPNLKFTFTVLNTDMVNAFALPGGYVYITRGLLALANSEAEVAGVLAHEIGHVTARHAAQRHSRSVLAGGLAAAIGIFTGSGELAQIAGSGLGIYLRGYSREQEFEADTLGVRYLKRAGFDPGAMARFLASLRAHSQLTAALMGQPESTVDESNIMATHPRTVERVQRAEATAGGPAPKDPIVGRDVFLGKINGMIYGDAPDQGYARGRDFLHPDLRFRFRVPEGYFLINQPSQVVARGPDGVLAIFAAAPGAEGREPYDYLVNVWAAKAQLSERKRLTINGLAAATAAIRIRTSDGVRDVRLVAIRRGREMFRFMFVAPTGAARELDRAYRETALSFRDVSAAEAGRWRPYVVRVVPVRRGDTVAGMAGRMAVERFKERHFRVINGLGPKDGVVAGQSVKIVVLGE